jgi:hypothetical protein
MPLSTYFSSAILNWIKSTTFPADPAAVYVSLHDGNPGDAGSGGTDVTTTIRVAGRVAVTFGSIAAKAMSNDADVDFGAAAGAADVDYFGIWDASSAGNFLGYGALVTPRAISASDPVKFPVGSLTIDLSNP